MRYKDLVQRNLEKIGNQLNVVKSNAQRGEQRQVNQTIDNIKEIIDQTQTYLNNETQQ
jgi:SLT domain-containing protein|tara:strand:+ start:230 stop:403 length:174 start_codon:yes stop_codon:yes gene_type:complete